MYQNGQAGFLSERVQQLPVERIVSFDTVWTRTRSSARIARELPGYLPQVDSLLSGP